jgi:hypothetical protein
LPGNGSPQCPLLTSLLTGDCLTTISTVDSKLMNGTGFLVLLVLIMWHLVGLHRKRCLQLLLSCCVTCQQGLLPSNGLHVCWFRCMFTSHCLGTAVWPGFHVAISWVSGILNLMQLLSRHWYCSNTWVSTRRMSIYSSVLSNLASVSWKARSCLYSCHLLNLVVMKEPCTFKCKTCSHLKETYCIYEGFGDCTCVRSKL